ncbi:hypothetical protein AAMO2058_001679000 [Amorphochlora amoebiformis]
MLQDLLEQMRTLNVEAQGLMEDYSRIVMGKDMGLALDGLQDRLVTLRSYKRDLDQNSELLPPTPTSPKFRGHHEILPVGERRNTCGDSLSGAGQRSIPTESEKEKTGILTSFLSFPTLGVKDDVESNVETEENLSSLGVIGEEGKAANDCDKSDLKGSLKEMRLGRKTSKEDNKLEISSLRIDAMLCTANDKPISNRMDIRLWVLSHDCAKKRMSAGDLERWLNPAVNSVGQSSFAVVTGIHKPDTSTVLSESGLGSDSSTSRQRNVEGTKARRSPTEHSPRSLKRASHRRVRASLSVPNSPMGLPKTVIAICLQNPGSDVEGNLARAVMSCRHRLLLSKRLVKKNLAIYLYTEPSGEELVTEPSVCAIFRKKVDAVCISVRVYDEYLCISNVHFNPKSSIEASYASLVNHVGFDTPALGRLRSRSNWKSPSNSIDTDRQSNKRPSGIHDHDYVVVAGCFNSKISAKSIQLSSSEGKGLSKSQARMSKIWKYAMLNQFSPLRAYDTLSRLLSKKKAFPGFMEGKINFGPTETYQPTTNILDPKTVPSWSRRILFRSKDFGRLTCNRYSMANITTGTSKPLSAFFTLNALMSGGQMSIQSTNSKRTRVAYIYICIYIYIYIFTFNFLLPIQPVSELET